MTLNGIHVNLFPMEQSLTNKELLTAIRGIVREEVRQPLEEVQTEIMDAMQTFASDVDRRFDRVEGCLDRVEQDVNGLKQDGSSLRTDLTAMRATMVTKSYLDDKFADEGARTGGHVRDTNLKVHALADALVAEGALRASSSSRITMMNPFPRRTSRRT